MNRAELGEHIFKTYGVEPDFPWDNSPDYAVYRHADNRKWFALVMVIPRRTLGLDGDGTIDVVNLKCDPVLIGSLRLEKGFFPAYHMSKEKWITVALDGTVDDERLKALVDMSFDLTAVRIKKNK